MHEQPETEPEQRLITLRGFETAMIGTGIGTLFWVAGYLLTRGDQTRHGMTIFCAMPFSVGFAMALMANTRTALAACCIASAGFSLAILVLVGLEGYICCCMAFPILAVCMFVGAMLGIPMRRLLNQSGKPGGKTGLVLMGLLPALAVADRVEKPSLEEARQETFATSVWIDASPEVVWRQLADMEPMHGSLPFLLWAGLPVPQRCTLDAEAVGAKRVCYFDQGIIAQTVTGWEAPTRLAIRVDGSTLPGRHWLTYLGAEYELVPKAHGSLLVRRTTIGTRLAPRWYWRPFEAWGVTSEHRYVLANVKRAAEQ